MTRPQVCAVLLLGLSLSACASPNRDAVLAGATRFVLAPSREAAVSQDSAHVALPAQITFDGAQGRSALYLEFGRDFAARGVPLRAFIALTPRTGAPLDAGRVVVEAWRVSCAWRAAELVSWSDKPELAPPYARAELSPGTSTEARIDVTELVRFAARHPDLDFGIALLGRGGSGHGLTFATGMNGGLAPRLEVYTR